MTSDLTSEMDCSALEPQHSVQIWTKGGRGREESIHILTNGQGTGTRHSWAVFGGTCGRAVEIVGIVYCGVCVNECVCTYVCVEGRG